MNEPNFAAGETAKSGNRLLLLVAGLGGLLYGIEGGIIAGALPYLAATSGLTAGQLSFVVAAVLLGGLISTAFAGMLADWFGRKGLMVACGLCFVISIPMIALAHGYGPLVLGRLIQGVGAGPIGVVLPLYLSESLGASSRGKGMGVFQAMLTMGIVVAAIIGYFFSLQVANIEMLNDAQKLFVFKDNAWRNIFWASLPPGILFVIGSLLVAESPRWLFRKGRKDAARAALLRLRNSEETESELRDMEETAAAEKSKNAVGEYSSESLLHRKYIIPFALACIILACNQATGINSIIGYNAAILIQAGLSDAHSHLAYVILTLINFLVTMFAVTLIDKKGRKVLLSTGSAGIIVSLVCTGLVFHKTEKQRVDVKDAVQAMVVQSNQTVTVQFNADTASKLLAGNNYLQPLTLVVIYSYGDFHAASKVVRSDDVSPNIEISQDGCLPSNKVVAFFQNPFGNFDKSKTAALTIDHAFVTPVPSESTGWLTAICIFCFMGFFAIGPGVCVWLALSELMPTRIRSNGMSVALLLNQAVATTIAANFLPSIGRHGYAMMFFFFAACTVVYFITATFFLPETKGKTLEEIEKYFEGRNKS